MRRVDVNSREFQENPHSYYRWLREDRPVCPGRLGFFMKLFLISRHADCVSVLKDPRFVRTRHIPFPVPRHLRIVSSSMILADEPAHRRLRNLVHRAFTPRALERLGQRLETLTHELLDRRPTELMQGYALPIPVTVIGEMLGVTPPEMARFQQGLQILNRGFSPWVVLRMLCWDLPRMIDFLRTLIARKRAEPGDDILSALIHAEEEGDKLSEDELLSMAYLLIVAGYETTVHLITNSIVCLLEHPQQLQRLQEQPALVDTAVEEIVRFRGPIQGTKPMYAREEVTLHGVTIAKGAAIMPLLDCANHDPQAFDNPHLFDIARTPNRHLGFGQGIHYCLGAPLARLETKVALTNLFARFPQIRLRGPLERQSLPLWRRYRRLPVDLGEAR